MSTQDNTFAYSDENENNTNNTTKKRNDRTWSLAKSFLERSYPNYNEKMQDLPEPNGIYRCFSKRSWLSDNSDGYFLLTDTHLNFYIEHDKNLRQYAFMSAQIKDITSICANYEKRFNPFVFFYGLLMSVIFLALAIIFRDTMTDIWKACLLLMSVGSASLMYHAFTSLAIRKYKINIGTLQGGMTVMGSSAGQLSSRMAWNNPMTVVYNATPDEYNLFSFVEIINARIALLQERGDFAFEEKLIRDLEKYDEH